jgi:hypothetical protein
MTLPLTSFEPVAQLAVAKAQALADRLEHDLIEPEHLLHVLAHDARVSPEARGWVELRARLDGARKRQGATKSSVSPDLMVLLDVAEQGARVAMRSPGIADLWRALAGDRRPRGVADLAVELAPGAPASPPDEAPQLH